VSEKAITPQDLHERIRRGEQVNLLDVRNRDEFEAWRIGGASVEATQVPYAECMAAKARGEVGEFVAELDVREPVVAVCPRGEASATVADLLREDGIEARNLAEGMQGWARVYVSKELSSSPAGATVLQYDRPATGCLSYLVVSGDEAAVVDPLRAFADQYDANFQHVKPHGAMYSMVSESADHARAVMEGILEVDSDLIYLATDMNIYEVAQEFDELRAVFEGYVDLSYNPDRSLIVEQEKEPKDPELVADRFESIAVDGEVEAVNGEVIDVPAESICIHGDGPNAVELLEAIQERADEVGIELQSLEEIASRPAAAD